MNEDELLELRNKFVDFLTQTGFNWLGNNALAASQILDLIDIHMEER